MNDVVNQLQEKIISFESKGNSDEQYGRRNNLEIKGIPNSISDDKLESTVMNALSKATNVHVTADDIEACHRIGKSKGSSKKTIAHLNYGVMLLIKNRKDIQSYSLFQKKIKSKLIKTENETDYFLLKRF